MAWSFRGFRSLIENGTDAVSLINTRGEILYASASTTKLLGYHPEELLGRSCFKLIHPKDRGCSNRALRNVLVTPSEPCHSEARVRCKDGHYTWVESTVLNLLFDSEVQAIVMQQRGINARKAAEAERQEHVDQLTHSNLRLQEFAHTAAHDLREPLRAITVYTEVLIQETRMDAKAKQVAGFMVDGAARMSVLIDDLLLFASTGKHEPAAIVNLEKAVTQASLNLAVAIEASASLLTVDPLPIVRGSEIHLVRLFQNLISNAVKYRGEDPASIHITAQRHGRQYWVVRVNDKGIGIASEHQGRVFMPFIRLANRNVPGTGLGLAVCKKIVEGLGGRIWIESELGVGSTFCFTIMAAEEDISADSVSQGAAA